MRIATSCLLLLHGAALAAGVRDHVHSRRAARHARANEAHPSGRGQGDSELPPPAEGLPTNECLTYAERYRLEVDPSGRSSHPPIRAGANEQHPDAKFALLMFLHTSEAKSASPSLDLVNYLRALAHEVTSTPGNAFNFYIMLERPAEKRGRLTRAAMLSYLPPDLRQFIILHRFDDIYHKYPALNLTGDWGPSVRAPYLTMAHFMDLYPGYEYAWITEYDLRYTGRNIGYFMNAAMNLAAQTSEADLSSSEWRLVDVNRVVARITPTSFEGLPDFLAIKSVEKTDKWRATGQKMATYASNYAAWTWIFMGSRQFYQALQKHSRRNTGTNSEGFMPTVAVHENMKVAAFPVRAHPEHGLNVTHFNMPFGNDVYSQWYNGTISCLPGYMLHPVKTKESFWPLFNDTRIS